MVNKNVQCTQNTKCTHTDTLNSFKALFIYSYIELHSAKVAVAAESNKQTKEKTTRELGRESKK